MGTVQRGLFEDITGKLVQYRDESHGFWRLGIGEEMDYKTGKAVIKSVTGKTVRVPFARVRRHVIPDKKTV